MVTKGPFDGELAQPMPPLEVGVLMSEVEQKRVIEERIQLENYKLGLLSERYGVNRGDYFSLALALAREFVPGFKDEVARGRPFKWTPTAKGYLYVDVERKKSEISELGIETRCVYECVAQLPRWSKFISNVEAKNRDPDPAETVRKKYQEAKSDPFCEICWKAFCLHKHSQTVEEWDNQADECLQQLLTQQ